MSEPSLFERLLSICGKRHDDPDVISLHAEEKLAPPPTSLGLYSPAIVVNESKGYRLHYMAALKRPETWPPQLTAKGFATYVHHIVLRRPFQRYLPEPFAIDMDEARAKELAIRSGRSPVTHLHTVYRLFERGERSLQLLCGPLSPILSLSIDELANDDPRIASFAYDQQTKLQKQAEKLAAPPAKSKRVFPPRRGAPQPEPLPAVLLDLRDAFEVWRRQKPRRRPSDGDYIDFQMYPEREVTFITGCTDNPGHEAEFYVFGTDGTGSGVAFWLVHDAPLEKQPVVFIGSEGPGQVWPVAKDLPSFLSLLAAGLGPREAQDFAEGDAALEPLSSVQTVLERHFPDHASRTPTEIVSDAARDFGDIEARLEELSYKP
jgi:hypothetical protein